MQHFGRQVTQEISFEFNESWRSFSAQRKLHLHQFSLNSVQNQKSFLMTHLTDGPSVNGRLIRPKIRNIFHSM